MNGYRFQRLTFLAMVAMLVITTPVAAAETLLWLRFEDGLDTGSAKGISFQPSDHFSGGIVGSETHACIDGRSDSGITLDSEITFATTSLTVECFFQVDHVGEYQPLIADWQETGDRRSWALMVTPRGSLRWDVSPDGGFHAANKLETRPRLIQPGRWYHAAAVSDGETSRIYLNGQLQGERRRPQPQVFRDNDCPVTVGRVLEYAGRDGFSLAGKLDEVRLTSDVLQPSQFLKTRHPMPPVTGPVPDDFELPFVAETRSEAEDWQQQARLRLMALVQRHSPRSSTPLDLRITRREPRQGYTLHVGSYQGNDRRIPFYLTVPDGQGPFPAVIALHGHGGSREAVFDSETPYQGFAEQLARGRYVVLAPSFPHQQYCAASLWDLMRAVDLLEDRTDVDADRIGAAGLSMGGEWTMWLAACDPRIRCAVISGWMCTTEGVFSVPNCECWELPGLVQLMDISEVHVLIAPRPVLFESAEHDPCFPIAFSRKGFERIRKGYQLFGAADQVQQDVWPAGHQWHGAESFPFLDQHLGGNSSTPSEE